MLVINPNNPSFYEGRKCLGAGRDNSPVANLPGTMLSHTCVYEDDTFVPLPEPHYEPRMFALETVVSCSQG